jgi:hypothetical protein
MNWKGGFDLPDSIGMICAMGVTSGHDRLKLLSGGRFVAIGKALIFRVADSSLAAAATIGVHFGDIHRTAPRICCAALVLRRT